jgi:hypothetical protein
MLRLLHALYTDLARSGESMIMAPSTMLTHPISVTMMRQSSAQRFCSATMLEPSMKEMRPRIYMGAYSCTSFSIALDMDFQLRGA